MFEPVVTSLTIGGARFLTGMHARWVGCMHDNVQRVYFANHARSYGLRSGVVGFSRRVSGKRLRPVAASDYWNRGIVRRYFIHRAFRAVVIDRKYSEKFVNPIEPMLEALDQASR